MKKILNILSNSKLYVITFMLSLFIISLIFILNDVTPFGEKSLLCVDFYHQYGPMLGELYDKLHSGGNLIYSFNMGLGLPFFRNFFNYLSSPFNILIMLFSRNNLVTSYTFIIGLKAVIASCTFVYFLSHKFNTKELFLIPLGIIYAFSAYYSAYYWNMMWLDGLVFLPIIALGIEYLVKDGKWKLYTISLALMLVSNYFIGYMICFFSVCYFIIFNIHELHFKKGEIKKALKKFFINIVKFGFASLLAGALVAVVLIPLFKSIASISASHGTIPLTQYYKFTVEDYLKFHLTGVPTTTFASDSITAPNISAGILSVALLLAFILNFEIPIKTKICYLLLLGVFIIAFFNPTLDYILHGMHVPNDLPYRYSFIYTFIFVTIGSYAAVNMKKLPYILSIGGYVFLMVLLLSITTDSWTGLNSNMIYINMILLTLYFIFYSGTKFISSLKNVFFLALAAVAAIDVVVSINYNWNITQVLETFYQDYNETEELLQYVDNYDNSEFYRIENVQMMTLNDPSWYNYHGMTTFTSMAYEDMAILQHKLGLPGNHINSYYYVQTTPIYDLMFDMKYFIGNTNDDKRYTPIKTIAETANQFNYNVSLGYGTNKELKDWYYNSSNPFDNQNDYIEKATGINNVLEKMSPTSTNEIYNDGSFYIVEYEYDNPGDNMYFYTESYAVDYFIIGTCLYYRNDNYTNYEGVSDKIYYSMLDNYDETKIINIKSEDKKVYVYVGYNSYIPNAFNMYTINQDKFKDAFNYFNNNKMNITKFRESYIEAYINTDLDYVYTSIPYDEGWSVYVDGKKVETYKLANALLTFDITPGTHKIEFKYRPKFFLLGLIISIISIIILIISFKLDKKKKHK